MLILVLQVFSIAQTGAVSAEVVSGLGQHAKTLPSYKLVGFQRVSGPLRSQIELDFDQRTIVLISLQASQAANICFLVSQCFTQLSLFSLIRNFSTTLTHLRVLQFTSMISILWAISFSFVEIFKCRPHLSGNSLEINASIDLCTWSLSMPWTQP